MKLENVNCDVLVLTAASGPVRRDAAGIPVAFRVLSTGLQGLTINGAKIEGQILPEDIRSILDYHAMKGELIPVDCEHLLRVLADVRGISEADLVRAEPLLGEKAAAGFVSLVDENGELWAKVDKWSARARELLSSAADKMYAYFSPIIRGMENGPLRITSIALTNTPALNGLDVLAASGEITLAFSDVQTTKTNGGVAMKFMTMLCGLFGLDVAQFSGEGKAESLFEKAAAEIEALRARSASFVDAVKTALALTDAPAPETAAGLILNLGERAKADAAALTDARGRLTVFETAEKRRLIDTLKAEGKLAEGQVGWAEKQDMAALTEFSKIAVPVIPMGRDIKTGQADTGKDVLALSDNDISVARMMGLDPAAVAKANGLQMPKA